MTHDEINALDEDGLRLEVARVLGFSNVRRYHDRWTGLHDTEMWGATRDNIPDWPRDIAAAEKLIDLMHADDCGIEIHDVLKMANNVWWDYEGTLYCPVGFGAEEFVFTGDTLAVAVSRAFLMFAEWKWKAER